jgi:hypothetical protein
MQLKSSFSLKLENKELLENPNVSRDRILHLNMLKTMSKSKKLTTMNEYEE